MRTVACGASLSRPGLGKLVLSFLLSLVLLWSAWPQNLAASRPRQDPAQAPPHALQTPEQLQQLVAPIALYPDSLVAQILAASTFPDQVVEADRWLQEHPEQSGEALAQAADLQPWDPSVKALVAFPSVLGNMDKNLAWTSSLGDAYYNQEQDVMDAVQVMRQRAQAAGTLTTTPQQTVTTQGSTVIIEPANPEVVYVPAYDPWVVYGEPILPWPGWYAYPGIWYEGPYVSWGVGFGIGFYGVYGWGWPYWGFDWHDHHVTHHHDRYHSGSRTFYNRNNYYRGGGARGAGEGRGGGGARGGVYNRPGATMRPFQGSTEGARGYGAQRGQSGVRSGAFSGYDHGGQARGFSARGGASFGGGARGGGRHR